MCLFSSPNFAQEDAVSLASFEFFEKLIESITASQASCALLYNVKGCLRVMFLLYFFAAADLSSFFCVVVVVVVLVMEIVVVVCVARVLLLQNAHWDIAVRIRECTASSSTSLSLLLDYSKSCHLRISRCPCLLCASVAKCSLAHQSLRSRKYRLLYDNSWSYHRRISRCPFRDCSQSFVFVICCPLIHVFNDLLSY